MKTLLAALLAALAFALPAQWAKAGDDVVLVELYTSQGCSSCPPADRNFASLADRQDVLALALHVDYWDYLGWRDTFGRPEHTRRQQAYRDLMGARVVYTPQVIVNGTFSVPGGKIAAIDDAIVRARAEAAPVAMNIVRDGGMLKAMLAPATVPERCGVWIASYDKSATVLIGRGENAGKTITYYNIVRTLMRVGRWDGTAQYVALPQPGAGQGVAVWLQDDKTGHVLAARFVED